MTSHPVDPALRRGTLATSVLDDIALEPRADGVAVGRDWDDRTTWAALSWAQLADAVQDVDPESTAGRLRLRDWLRAFLALTGPHPASPRGTPGHHPDHEIVALALPRTHVLHPGPGWPLERMPGGLLDVGLGLRPAAPAPATDPRQTRTDQLSGTLALATPVPPGAVRAAGVCTATWWRSLAARRDAMAVLAADRLGRTGGGVLRPVGGVDVPTLLTGRWLRHHLADTDGTGMRALAVPIRSRGWFDLVRIDPAFVGAAAAATDPELRCSPSPLLVTRDEISMPLRGVGAAELARAALVDAVTLTDPLLRSMLHR